VPTPVKDADQSCARCHLKIYRSYLGTPMANASGAAGENLKPVNYLHRPSGVTYSIAPEGDHATLGITPGSSPNSSLVRQLQYFLGSGHLGVTYLYFLNTYLFEAPVAWYAASGGYDMKPGLGEMRHAPPAIPIESSCLRCHMSTVEPVLPGTLNRYASLPFHHEGITCESCHGDSDAHVGSRGKSAIVNPARLDAERRDSVCISCHLEGDVTVDRAGRSALNYRPGESISKYLAFYVRGTPNPATRGVSEVEQLSQSTCKRMSGDRMSCMSCHDPHFTPGPKERAAFYRGKCLACHAEPKFATSHHSENPDCTSCHMPRAGAQNIPHVAWTDHRILRIPEAGQPEQSVPAGTEPTPIFSPEATERDLAMAEYKLLLEGDRTLEGPAAKHFSALDDAIARDPEALDAWGNLNAERGDLPAADRIFHQVLALNPVDLTALSNLGILLAKEGKIGEAAGLLGAAFDRNRDIAGLALNLARVECADGDGQGAQKTLAEALVFSPDLAELRRLADEVKNPDNCAGSKKTGQ
jgi:predicted CXXCH cytochrome family protein